ncbi:hypothetical protein [Enterococcus dispar]|uniref:hypothetical protein n=1 Tax=Enterococcus dispar TaxID=44009 RepID=UPI00189EAAD2|nr:hypothetical protein [Enterococcus dispar]
MATKSFTENYSFNVKNAKSLIVALNNDKSPRKQHVPNVTNVNDKKKIQAMFFEDAK